jgi:TRAP-type mannitol/chloroaromatic compound transport system substrate-binding protein
MRKMTKNRPDRRHVLGLGLAAAAGTVAPAARADDQIVWKMVTAWPKDMPGVGVNARRIAEMIGAMSGGRLTVKLFGAGEFVAGDRVFDAVSVGTAELGHSAAYYWQAKDRAFHYFTGVPFGLTAIEHAGWLYFGGGLALWERAYQPFGVVPFLAGSTGPQAAGWFMTEIRTLDDLRGVKMRIAGLGAEVFRRLGVTIVPVPATKIVDALKNGQLTAAEWIGPWNDLALGFNRSAKFYYMPGFNEIGSAIELIVNQAAWSALPIDLKEIVRRAAMASAMESYADFTYHNIDAFQSLAALGVEVRSFPVAILEAAAREAEAILAEIANSSPMATEVHQSFAAYRNRAAEYCRSSDLAALKIREVALSS